MQYAVCGSLMFILWWDHTSHTVPFSDLLYHDDDDEDNDDNNKEYCGDDNYQVLCKYHDILVNTNLFFNWEVILAGKKDKTILLLFSLFK